MKNPHDIILRPVLTEKAYEGIADQRYIFEVAIHPTKPEIKQAIEEIFKVKVTNVNTLNRAGKRTRTRTGYGRRANEKRAIVTVAEGQSIDIFGN